MELTKAMYSLEEADDISHSVSGYILQQAVTGQEKIYVKLPIGADAFSVDFIDLYPSDIPAYRELNKRYPPALPIRMCEVSFLEIHSDTCSGIINNGYSRQSVFKKALFISNDGTIKILEPKRPAESSPYSLSINHNSFIWYFACYPRDIEINLNNRKPLLYPTAFNVERDSAFVTRQSLVAAIEKSSKPIFDSTCDLPLVPAAHISNKLLNLRLLLIDHWTKLGPDGFPMPSAKDFAAQLLTNYGFKSAKQALGGAAALRLSSLHEDRLTGRLRLMAPGIKALIECADLHWMHSLNGSEFEYKTDDMVLWLQDRTGLTRHASEGCIALLRPESAPKAGRKRQLQLP